MQACLLILLWPAGACLVLKMEAVMHIAHGAEHQVTRCLNQRSIHYPRLSLVRGNKVSPLLFRPKSLSLRVLWRYRNLQACKYLAWLRIYWQISNHDGLPSYRGSA